MGNKCLQNPEVKMKSKKCSQCKSLLEEKKFDIGYGIQVATLHCRKCGFNLTDEKVLNKAMSSLHDRMSRETKIIRVGSGLGVRIPNELAKNYRLKNGEGIIIKPETDGIKLIVSET